MRFSKKTLIMAASMVLCMAMTGLGTVAYLTDRAAIANTFTVGNIEITVDEAVVDQYGRPVESDKKLADIDGDGFADEVTQDEYKAWVDEQLAKDETLTEDDFMAYEELPTANRTKDGNEYKLIPGVTYTKDPTLTVLANSEEAYVRMAVKLTNAAKLKAAFGEEFKLEEYVNWDSENWPLAEKKEENDTLIYIFDYKEVVKTSEAEQMLPALFTQLTIPYDMLPETLRELGDFEIQVEGYAIQTAAFNGDKNAAWAAFDSQNIQN